MVMEAISEFEGAVLVEIHHRDRRTAFQVRRAFQLSPSSEWSGSAGAVYPAIRRLTAAGLVEAVPLPGGRNARSLALTEAGLAAMHAWAGDAARAVGVGMDPFRLRSGVWRVLPPAQRRDVLERVNLALTQAAGPARSDDVVETARDELAALLQESRRRWVEAELAAIDEKARPGR
jgi:DNA-binding PadR family transcriptional regulator